MIVKSKNVVGLIAAGTLLVTAGVLRAQSDLGGWQKITAIPDATTHLVPVSHAFSDPCPPIPDA